MNTKVKIHAPVAPVLEFGVAPWLEQKPAGSSRTAKPIGSQGMGKPEAKKICNPQPTINLKKWAVSLAGGSLDYRNRQWEVTGLADRPTLTISSRSFAALDLNGFCKFCEIPTPTSR